jgi:hypothetical protein
MKRKSKEDKVKSCRLKIIEEEGKQLAVQLGEWAAHQRVQEKLKEIYDNLDLLDIANDRMAELLLPLQAVLVERVGPKPGSYPFQVLKRYTESLATKEQEAERQSEGVQLLMACREIFQAEDFLSTQDLIKRLVSRDEEPWGEISQGKEITPRKLALLLEPFGIKPARNDTQTERGYYRHSFKDAWARYLPPPPTAPPQPV